MKLLVPELVMVEMQPLLFGFARLRMVTNYCETGGYHHRGKLFRNAPKYMGKQLTVRFQNLTALGVPRFPVGVAIRDYE